jgi:hypothetical protein
VGEIEIEVFEVVFAGAADVDAGGGYGHGQSGLNRKVSDYSLLSSFNGLREPLVGRFVPFSSAIFFYRHS